MKVVRIGLDIAKTVFQIHGVDQQGKTVLKKTLSRGEVLGFFANTPVSLIGIEACASSHYWAREWIKLGHDARRMAAQFVSPYRKSGKNDANDAEAICEAVGRLNMRFVPVKSEEAQAVLAVHRVRSLTVAERTARVNQVRGLLGIRDCDWARHCPSPSPAGRHQCRRATTADPGSGNHRRTTVPPAHAGRAHSGLRPHDIGLGQGLRTRPAPDGV